jgi:AhpD family alkylhydroperoxidase
MSKDTDDVARHGLIAWPRPDQLDEQQQVVYDAIVGSLRTSPSGRSPLTDDEGRMQGPFNAMVATPALGLPWLKLGTAILFENGLTDRLRELVILWVAAVRRSNFEWHAHKTIAATAGVSAREIAQLRQGDLSGLPEPEASVLMLVDQLLANRTAPEELVRRVANQLGESTLVDVIITVGHYDTLAMSMATLRVPLPEGAEPEFPDDGPVAN